MTDEEIADLVVTAYKQTGVKPCFKMYMQAVTDNGVYFRVLGSANPAQFKRGKIEAACAGCVVGLAKSCEENVNYQELMDRFRVRCGAKSKAWETGFINGFDTTDGGLLSDALGTREEYLEGKNTGATVREAVLAQFPDVLKFSNEFTSS